MAAHKLSDYIMSVPVVSLYHLTEEDRSYLSDIDDYIWPMVAKYDHGYFVWMIAEDVDDSGDLSHGMMECFRRHFPNPKPGETICIRFDEDGCELEGIPITQD